MQNPKRLIQGEYADHPTPPRARPEHFRGDIPKDSEHPFGIVADAVPALIWMSDADNRCVYVNRRWLEFTGRALEQELGEGWTESIHPDDLRRCMEQFTAAFGTRAGINTEYRLRRVDGSYRWLLNEGRPRFSGTAFAGYIGTCIDITERKLAEDELARHREHLQELVNARTAELSTLAAHMESVREEQNASIARELHDEFGSILATLNMNLVRAQKSLHGRRDPGPAEKICASLELVNTAIKVMRRIVDQLRPTVLDDLGIAAAIRWQVEEFSTQSGIASDIRLYDEDAQSDKASSIVLFRILQEALTNITRHAQATKVQVSLSRAGGTITMTIRDNGVGFVCEGGRCNTQSHGLRGMQERVWQLGGDILISARPGGGTRIRVCFPDSVAVQHTPDITIPDGTP